MSIVHHTEDWTNGLDSLVVLTYNYRVLLTIMDYLNVGFVVCPIEMEKTLIEIGKNNRPL